MSYELRPEETLADGLRRTCRSEIAKAIGIATGSRETDDTPVHQTRKHIKKARAALRLVRTDIGRALFRQQDQRLRDAGRLLADLRDAEVRLETVRQLGAIRPTRGRGLYRRLEQMLTLELESFLAAFAEWQMQIVPLLQTAEAAVNDWPLQHFGYTDLRQAIQASYKAARRELGKARKNSSPEAFHEFRSKAKRLTYQLRIVRPINPVVLNKLDEELTALNELLGRAHDLTFLERRLEDSKPASASARMAQRKLATVLEVSSSDINRAAADLAERFFAERPRDFGCRVDSWLSDWTHSRAESVAEALLS